MLPESDQERLLGVIPFLIFCFLHKYPSFSYFHKFPILLILVTIINKLLPSPPYMYMYMYMYMYHLQFSCSPVFRVTSASYLAQSLIDNSLRHLISVCFFLASVVTSLMRSTDDLVLKVKEGELKALYLHIWDDCIYISWKKFFKMFFWHYCPVKIVVFYQVCINL